MPETGTDTDTEALALHKANRCGGLDESCVYCWRAMAHAVFDRLFLENGGPLRKQQAYYWLAHRMGLTEAECHIALFTVEQCRQVKRLVKKGTWRNWAKDKRDWR